MMKRWWIAMIVATGCVSCQRDESEKVEQAPKPLAPRITEFAPDRPKPTKTNRPADGTVERAGPLAGDPNQGIEEEAAGEVPVSGETGPAEGVVIGNAEGEIVAGPPALEEEQPPLTAPLARQVPGNASMVFSPYDNRIIDVRGVYAGSIVLDPGSPAGSPRYFTVPVLYDPQTEPEVIEEEEFEEDFGGEFPDE